MTGMPSQHTLSSYVSRDTTTGLATPLTGNEDQYEARFAAERDLLDIRHFLTIFEQDRNVRTMVVAEVAERIGVDPTAPTGKAHVCAAFQDLMRACSWSSFMVRRNTFTAEDLRTLQKSQREQVWTCASLFAYHVCAVRLVAYGPHSPVDTQELRAPAVVKI